MQQNFLILRSSQRNEDQQHNTTHAAISSHPPCKVRCCRRLSRTHRTYVKQ